LGKAIAIHDATPIQVKAPALPIAKHRLNPHAESFG